MTVQKALMTGFAVVFLGGSMSGCLSRGRGEVVYYADVDPPLARTTVVQSRPGHVWIDGYWFRDGNQWVWIDGRMEVERPSYHYVQGRWHKTDRRWLWNPGRWQSAGAPRAVRVVR